MAKKLQLALRPVWEESDVARLKTAEFLRTHNLDTETTDAISMVACELTENANKYGTFASDAEPAIFVDVTVRENRITVEVRNPVGAESAKNLTRLDATIQRIRGYQDPFEVYVDRLREVSGQRLNSPESGLGLVRVAYEGQSILDFFVNDEDTLAVSAIFPR